MDRKRKILWVEDDAPILEPMIYPLRDSGYDIITALDAANALFALKNDKFDLLLLDIFLPVGDCIYIDKQKKYIGIEILKLMRTWEIRVPTIIFSVVKTSELGDINGLGVIKILYKARLMPDKLLEIVENVFESSQL